MDWKTSVKLLASICSAYPGAENNQIAARPRVRHTHTLLAPLILSIPCGGTSNTRSTPPCPPRTGQALRPYRPGPFPPLPPILCKGCGSQDGTGLLRREQSPLQPPVHDSCPRRDVWRGLWSQDRHPWRAQALLIPALLPLPTKAACACAWKKGGALGYALSPVPCWQPC